MPSWWPIEPGLRGLDLAASYRVPRCDHDTGPSRGVRTVPEEHKQEHRENYSTVWQYEQSREITMLQGKKQIAITQHQQQPQQRNCNIGRQRTYMNL